MKTTLAIMFTAIALSAPAVNHAHAASQWPANHDCRMIAGYIGVQNYMLTAPSNAFAADDARAFVALVQALRAEHPEYSGADVIAICGIRNAQPARNWSLAQSQARMYPAPAPARRTLECYGDGHGYAECE